MVFSPLFLFVSVAAEKLNRFQDQRDQMRAVESRITSSG
jgi:hypothetical protein